jgi:hypothetical protein
MDCNDTNHGAFSLNSGELLLVEIWARAVFAFRAVEPAQSFGRICINMRVSQVLGLIFRKKELLLHYRKQINAGSHVLHSSILFVLV